MFWFPIIDSTTGFSYFKQEFRQINNSAQNKNKINHKNKRANEEKDKDNQTKDIKSFQVYSKNKQ